MWGYYYFNLVIYVINHWKDGSIKYYDSDYELRMDLFILTYYFIG